MKESRHPHPHVDPREPKQGTRPGTNPPLFAWKPRGKEIGFRLQVARDRGFGDLCLDIEGLQDPVFLPEKALGAGRYSWKWSLGSAESEVFEFEITAAAVVLEVPSADVWLDRLPKGHPRLYVRPEDREGLRQNVDGDGQGMREELLESAEALLDASHEMAEPAFLPDRGRDYAAFQKVWYPTMWGSRRFVKGAEALGLAYLATGKTAYARAACRRLVSISSWDPEGSSDLGHNDEAHMSVIWHGAHACDWVWDRFTDDEREQVIAQYRRRGEITYDHMHNRGLYGISRFDSHAGREIVFLANLAFVFHDHIPEARNWLDWLRPVLCGIWPSWAGEDGGWAQGVSYSRPYVTIMTMFASALKRGTGIDLYRRPFWRNYPGWLQWCLPAYAEWMGFGDSTERWGYGWQMQADLIDLIGREAGCRDFDGYVRALREEAEVMDTPSERKMPGVSAQLFTAPERFGDPVQNGSDRMLRVFSDVGWAAVRTDREDRERDVALVFRSSPYGSISHSHANNNDFILHSGGRVMAMPSGYYAGSGSAHHVHWVRHTKSHNCITLSGATQPVQSYEARGAVECAFEDEQVVYFRGNADASYRAQARRCWRHVMFLKAHACFVMVDEVVGHPGIYSAVQWNIHSWNRFGVDEEARRFFLVRGGSSLEGHFLFHNEGFFSLSEGWDPPPMRGRDDTQWYPQYHLRFTPADLVERRNLGVILCPGHRFLDRARVERDGSPSAEVARIGEDLVMVNQAEVMEYGDIRSDALVILRVQGVQYEIGEEGISAG